MRRDSAAGHQHSWYFVHRPGGWLASCGCGLEVTVELRPDGRSTWEWTLHGETASPWLMLDAISGVLSQRAELAARDAGRN